MQKELIDLDVLLLREKWESINTPIMCIVKKK